MVLQQHVDPLNIIFFDCLRLLHIIVYEYRPNVIVSEMAGKANFNRLRDLIVLRVRSKMCRIAGMGWHSYHEAGHQGGDVGTGVHRSLALPA